MACPSHGVHCCRRTSTSCDDQVIKDFLHEPSRRVLQQAGSMGAVVWDKIRNKIMNKIKAYLNRCVYVYVFVCKCLKSS